MKYNNIPDVVTISIYERNEKITSTTYDRRIDNPKQQVEQSTKVQFKEPVLELSNCKKEYFNNIIIRYIYTISPKIVLPINYHLEFRLVMHFCEIILCFRIYDIVGTEKKYFIRDTVSLKKLIAITNEHKTEDEIDRQLIKLQTNVDSLLCDYPLTYGSDMFNSARYIMVK